jgi:3',5'-cyclic AMP phosphodiesterase CpdA
MTKFLRLIAALAAGVCALEAQTFIQMSDPQFGMYSKNQNFTHETANFEFAIATANRLKPAFVVVTGDLVNKGGDAAQAAEYHRLAAKLSKGIRLFSVPGNHDVENEPTKESLARYRKGFGPDYYTFQVGGITGIVLNSNLEKDPHNVPEEASRMEAWFKEELAKAKTAGGRVIVFQHIPFFLSEANEADQYFNIPHETRSRYLKMMHDAGVESVFAGHYHRNSEGRDGSLDMVTTGPVGMPLEGAKSGMRIVMVTPAGVKHRYYDFGELPETLEPSAPAK